MNYSMGATSLIRPYLLAVSFRFFEIGSHRSITIKTDKINNIMSNRSFAVLSLNHRIHFLKNGIMQIIILKQYKHKPDSLSQESDLGYQRI